MNKWTERLITLVFCSLATVLSAARADGQMTQDEAMVRRTYAKLAYASKIGTIHDVLAKRREAEAAELDYQLVAKTLKFELSGFSGGSVNSIASRVFAELVTKPDGQDVLDISLGTLNFKEDLKDRLEVRETTETAAQLSWQAGQNLSEDWNVPFEQMLLSFEAQNKTKYLRYASYGVTVTFAGRSRRYKAMFLFGNGEFPILPLDNITNNSALGGILDNSFYDKTLYPAVLLESSVAQRPAVANWLKSHQVRDPSCRSGQRQVCCDPATLTCGVAEADVSSALDKAKPVSRAVRPSPLLSSIPRSLGAPRFLTVSAPIPSARIAGDCSDFDSAHNGLVANATGTEQHTSGNHTWHDAPVGTCT
jgi:hypothetical protein